jgi:integrase
VHHPRSRERVAACGDWTLPLPRKLVFPSANSTPLRNRNFRRDSFDPAAAALGLKLTPHNLRDTAASLAIQAGASVVAVARLLGHESAATTLNLYAGLFPTDLTTSRYASTPPQDRPSRNNECHVALVPHRPQI